MWKEYYEGFFFSPFLSAEQSLQKEKGVTKMKVDKGEWTVDSWTHIGREIQIHKCKNSNTQMQNTNTQIQWGMVGGHTQWEKKKIFYHFRQIFFFIFPIFETRVM